MKNIQKFKRLSPKLDVVFQAIFGEEGSENITKDFLEKILKRKITKITLDKNLVLRREFREDKLGVLDVFTELDEKEKCNIELQIVDKKNIIERILFYWSRLYSKQIKEGEDYSKLKRTIIVLIADFKIKDLEELDYHSTWKIMETKNKIILTNNLEIDILELPKIEGKENVKDELLDWLYFLEQPKGERVTKKMEENEALKEAVKKLDRISEDKEMQRIAELREKAIRDEKATYAKGLEDGEIRGEARGLQRGRTDRNNEIAKKLLLKKMPIEDIIEITGLTKEEIEELK